MERTCLVFTGKGLAASQIFTGADDLKDQRVIGLGRRRFKVQVHPAIKYTLRLGGTISCLQSGLRASLCHNKAENRHTPWHADIKLDANNAL